MTPRSRIGAIPRVVDTASSSNDAPVDWLAAQQEVDTTLTIGVPFV
jgi:hypothetical protein